MKKIYENESCDVFCGFYESVLYNSDTLYNWEYDSTPDGYYWDFVKGGFVKFQNETCEDYVDAMRDNFTDNPLDVQLIKYHSLWSPRYYNFYTDRIRIVVKFDLRKLKIYCLKTVREEFHKYLNEHWSSRSGFCSFIPNTANKFENEYKERKDKRDLLIDIMLEFYFIQFINFQNVIYAVCENDWERIHEHITLFKQGTDNACQYHYDTDKGQYVVTEEVA